MELPFVDGINLGITGEGYTEEAHFRNISGSTETQYLIGNYI